ncbi:hypothetical protein [Limnoglobus roseus]|uniref:Uncharacterized protein n=1 Tax=Limnoglobus roseus TaxID=2598579 RepID=A0A5C1AAY1_9BACT|nr:hypothetical protein [Limnoglobus roseus]QEL14198.1 hypothetical protein PX52LOC_01068 [Limnoglobus roseus]
MRRISRLILGSFAIIGLATAVAAQAPPPAPPAAPPAGTPAAPAAPPAAPAATTDLYPLKAGSVWKYKLGDGQDVQIKVDAVKDGEATLSTMVANRAVAKETVKVQADGVYRTKINDSPITPPVKILALPAKKDGSWTVDSKVQEQPLKGKYTIKDEKEKVKTKDGKEFEAVVVDAPELDVAGQKTSVKTWYSAGKGMVKLSYVINNYEATIELVEYTEGK